ncbi:MAG TPA: aminotransferase class IV [Acidimicrobiales bacterium]|nr:aminotransferase class IV [Acidimicrobiales bacterium]
MPLAYVNGALLAEEDARISVFDHGLVVGDGVFETVLLHNGAPFALTRHLQRLERSATGLGISPPPSEEVAAAVAAVVGSVDYLLGRIRITVTAGLGPLGSGRIPGPPTLVVACSEVEDEDHLGRAAIVPWTRNEHGALTGLKTTSYAENALALARAAEEGADEALFANTAGMLCEGTGSNIFVVHEGELVTPPLSSGCLAGVTRALVLERIAGHEADVPMAELDSPRVTEAFLTSTIRGVQPLACLGRRELAAPGPESEKAALCYRELLGEVDP